MTRRQYIYRVVVDEYPPRSHYSQPDYDPAWKPDGWVRIQVGVDEFTRFWWPSRRQYISYSGAVGRANLLSSYGAKVHVERSLPVEWPT